MISSQQWLFSSHLPDTHLQKPLVMFVTEDSAIRILVEFIEKPQPIERSGTVTSEPRALSPDQVEGVAGGRMVREEPCSHGPCQGTWGQVRTRLNKINVSMNIEFKKSDRIVSILRHKCFFS